MIPRKILLILVTFVMLSAGCATSRRVVEPSGLNDRRASYQVSVRSSGKDIARPDDPLVHYREVSQRELLVATSKLPGKLRIPFGGVGKFDRKGNPIGFALVQTRSFRKLPSFGLRDGDLVTAIGKRHSADMNDLSFLFRDLQQNGTGSVTLRRNGEHHKIIYSLKR